MRALTNTPGTMQLIKCTYRRTMLESVVSVKIVDTVAIAIEYNADNNNESNSSLLDIQHKRQMISAANVDKIAKMLCNASQHLKSYLSS